MSKSGAVCSYPRYLWAKYSSQFLFMLGVILGTKHILHPTKKLYAWPHKIEFHFLGTETVKGFEANNANLLREKVRERMLDFIESKKEKLA